MKKAVSRGMFSTRNQELALLLQKNPGDRRITSELFDSSDIDSNQAIDLFIYGHSRWHRRVFPLIRRFAQQGCYAPAEFELMIKFQPDYMEDLLDLMDASTSGRATQEVHQRAICLRNFASKNPVPVAV
ncbi:MAG: hypothetical protein Q7T49_02790 [bacterium]|nr:hypothetical protein [bacterium]